jgi:CheY-specific phosphatase CheX/anti-anti-sigma regulatory factor
MAFEIYIPKTFKKSAVVIKPQGFLDGNNANLIITPQDIKNFEMNKIKSVELIFSSVINVNLNAARFLNDVFEHLYKKNIESFIIAPNKNVESVFLRLKEKFFNIIENVKVASIFCEDNDSSFDKNIYLYSDDVENKNMLLYYLIKRGYSPIVLNSQDELDKKKKSNPDDFFIEKSVISKISNRVVSFTKDNMIFFYLDGFLDGEFAKEFDIEYFRRSLIIGFKVFVFDATYVKGINIHAVRYLAKLAVESAEYGALLCFIGLETKELNKNMLIDMEDSGYMFFNNMDEFNESQEVKEAVESVTEIMRKKKRYLTKDTVNLLPYFINATIESVELMTGVQAKKDKPDVKELKFNYKDKNYIASSIGFYGDVDGVLVLVFSENLTNRISKILVGEETKTKEELIDIVSEFANIIVGNVKATMSKQDKKIDLTLPKVFNDIETLFVLVKEKKGIEVRFDFEGEDFYFFLTR